MKICGFGFDAWKSMIPRVECEHHTIIKWRICHSVHQSWWFGSTFLSCTQNHLDGTHTRFVIKHFIQLAFLTIYLSLILWNLISRYFKDFTFFWVKSLLDTTWKENCISAHAFAGSLYTWLLGMDEFRPHYFLTWITIAVWLRN